MKNMKLNLHKFWLLLLCGILSVMSCGNPNGDNGTSNGNGNGNGTYSSDEGLIITGLAGHNTRYVMAMTQKLEGALNTGDLIAAAGLTPNGVTGVRISGGRAVLNVWVLTDPETPVPYSESGDHTLEVKVFNDPTIMWGDDTSVATGTVTITFSGGIASGVVDFM